MKRLGRIFIRVKSKRGNVRNAKLPASRISEGSRFALRELSNLTKIAPSLTGKFNQIIKNSKLYPETKIVVMTGNLETDRKAGKIASEMHELKNEIASGVRIADRSHFTAKRASWLKEAERLESRLNHLKMEFRALMLTELHKN